MKTRNYLPLILFVCIVCLSCSVDTIDADVVKTDEVQAGDLKRLSHPDVIAYRDNYQLVVKDDDNWELMLNLKKIRRISYSDSLWSYEGHLIYKLSYYLIKGKASAIYDGRTNILTVCANDSAWNRGMIHYSILIQSDSYNPTANYCYMDKPTNMHAIGTDIMKGYLGSSKKSSSKKSSKTSSKTKPEVLTPVELKEIESFIPSKYEDGDLDNAIFNKK